MNISAGILELLKRHRKVAVPEFGVFSTENSRAIFDADKKTILPPAKRIVFDANYLVEDEKLVEYISLQNNISQETAKSRLKIQTDYWKNLLQKNEEFSVEGLGNFYISENKLVFKGNRIQKESPDFYGLEEINISEIKNGENLYNEPNTEEKGSYQFNNSILWIFLVAVPVLGLAYLGITQQERLFGKKSFDDITVKNSTHRIENGNFKVDVQKLNATADSLKAADSLKQDSVRKSAVVPVKSNAKKWTPKKKWSSKKSTNQKWKSKKRPTH